MQCFLEIVPDRSQRTLVEVLRRNVLPESIIISDEWRGYSGLRESGFQHYTVNHSQNFVNPLFPNVHTQGIESFWSRLKFFFRRNKLRNRVHLKDYLAEFLFREKSVDVFDSLLSILS